MEFIAFDLETHQFQPGLLAPPIVCGSYCGEALAPELATPAEIKALVRGWLLNPDVTLVGANIAYDFGCLCAADASFIPLVFDAYEQGHVWDVQIFAALHMNERGLLFKDPKTGGPLKGPSGKQSKRYSLEIVSQLYLDRHNAKENDEYRLRYAELEGKPFSEWPASAVQYPKDDAKNTLDVALAQYSLAQEPDVMVLKPVGEFGWNHLTHQCRAAWCMHLGSIYGMRTDGAAVAEVRKNVEARLRDSREVYVAHGFIREDGTKDGPTLKRAVMRAYGATETCKTCQGAGKVPSEKTGKPVNCPACSGAGLELTPHVPKTATGGVCADRDSLSESGDPVLEGFAQISEAEKLNGTYLPFLERGTSLPINVQSNVLVATGRASYDGLLQLLPRGHGIRETFVARPGRVYCSVDYAALELCTLAQVNYTLFGHSAMRDAINEKEDPGALHTLFAAKMLNTDADDFTKRVKAGDKQAKNYRQMAKAANFGFPGGMGPVKLVLAKRKEGLSFCKAYDPDAQCGAHKVVEWKGLSCAPTCQRCIEVATELRAQWFAQWPEMETYFEWVNDLPGVDVQCATIISPITNFVRGGLGFSDGANHSFQSLAGFGAKHALWQVSKACYTDRASPLWGSRPMAFVHDEILAELPEGRAHDAAYEMAKVMVKSMREFVPDVYVKAEPAIARRWYKDMEAAFDLHGKLTTWEPGVKK